MAIANLSSQYISSSFQNLMQISSSNAVYNGAGNQVTTLLVSASYATTSSYALNAATGSQGITGSQGTQGIQGRQGTTGTQGVQGTSVQGATGAGTQGTIGSQGATGTGIQGTSGAGTQGAVGAGSQGLTGIQGVQGSNTGIQGTAGSLGYTPNNTGITWDNSGNLVAETSPIYQSAGGVAGVWTGDTRGTIDLSVLGAANPGSGLVIPTTIPNNPVNGSMYVDLAGNRLKIYDTGTGGWRNITII